MSDIKVKVGSEKDCVQTISVEFPASTVKQKIEQAFEKVRNQVKIPGFRPGKTPMEIVKESYKENAYARAQDDLLQEGVSEALKAKKINPIQSPVIQSMKFHPEKAFEFEFQVEVAPSFKVSGYKGLKINKKVTKVTDEELKKALDEIANMNAKLSESKDEILGNAHFAVIDYEGTIDGKTIEGAKSDNFLIDMAAPQTIAGLAEGLVGAKVGESREVKVKFPEDSPAKELAGKDALFKVKLNAIKQKQVPVLDDEFAKDLGMESVDQLKSKVRENIQREHEDAARRDVETQVMDQLIEENKFPLPQSLIDKQVEHLTNRQRDRMARQGFSKADQDKMIDGMKADAKKQAEKDVRLAYVLNAIADAEKIEPSQEDLDAKIKTILERTEAKEKSSMEKYLRGAYSDRLRSELREAKLFEWLIANAKVKEVA